MLRAFMNRDRVSVAIIGAGGCVRSSINIDDLFYPLILHRNVSHPSFPNLAFIDMYRDVYWVIIELQTRWIDAIFSNRLSILPDAVQ
jgi:hypothetical protein